jgi:hypothetical protein
MRTAFAALLVLPVLAAPAAAQCGKSGAINFGFGADFGLKGYYSAGCGPAPPPCGYGGGGGGPPQAGPWYLYWPLEAHFQTPAPTGYPYWPSPQTLPNGTASVPITPGVPPSAYFQPTAYGGGTPGYWYGR